VGTAASWLEGRTALVVRTTSSLVLRHPPTARLLHVRRFPATVLDAIVAG